MTGPDEPEEEGYTLRISRLTIDKLGVKLYDRVSAVVAELIANAYDADAENVWVELPLSTALASKNSKTGELGDRGYVIVVSDDGHGMTPSEARNFYLLVGRDRRVTQGERSRKKKRLVMGRKGIGKLAPFGICKRIEVLSSGGDYVPGEGYFTTHFFLDFDDILRDTDEDVPLEVGDLDGLYDDKPGTVITLTSFLSKRVPGHEDFLRQIGVRFAFADPAFHIHIRDTRANPPVDTEVGKFQVATQETTFIDVSGRPVHTSDGEVLPVTGWVAMAKESHKHEELAGVRIYARGKIVATTRDFEQPAGFTGEFTMRSYLVGEVFADWLDEQEDLIRTDRQSILWDSDRGSALRAWGAQIIKQVAAQSAKPRREKKREQFVKKSRIKERATERYNDESVVDEAVKLANRIGAFAAEDELEDEEYVDGLTEIILSVAPHQALVEAFKAIARKQDATMDELINLFGKTKLAEMASYAQVSAERVQSIRQLQHQISQAGVSEADFQDLISNAPWLIRPDWTVLTSNQSLRTFRDRFTTFFKQNYDRDLNVAITYERKRPDFTLIQHGAKLRIVEIKVPGHAFDDADYERLQNYVAAFRQFFDENRGIAASFPDGWHIDLIADDVNLKDLDHRFAFESFETRGWVVRQTWDDFLMAAVRAHEQILDIYEQANADEESR